MSDYNTILVLTFTFNVDFEFDWCCHS